MQTGSDPIRPAPMADPAAAPVFAAPVFEAVIVPHRSLSARALWVLVGVLCALSAGVSALMLWLGAWPAVGFCGAEIALAVALLRRHARGNRACELLLLSDEGLRIVRTDVRGRRVERALSPTWLRVMLEERPGRVPVLWLQSRGRRMEVAAELGETEKRQLADALRAALHRWRNPVFDNPQLR